jgi:hypothetical protein
MSNVSTYQLVLLGYNNAYISKIIDTFQLRVEDLGINLKNLSIINGKNFDQLSSNSPAVCLYFGDNSGIHSDLGLLDQLLSASVFILPVVSSLNQFSMQIPEKIQGINGFELCDATKIEALVSNIMEGLSLLRLARRLFISYRRKESRSIAIQLYEHLDAGGFDVFLDTHSVRPGERFQEELWHRLVDTDVVVLLHTPGFLESEWTTEELAKASAMSIGILQLIWPGHHPTPNSGLCFPRYLKKGDFINDNSNQADANFKDEVIVDIVAQVESLRARSLAARQDNIIKEFISSAKNHGFSAVLQPEKFITVKMKDGKDLSVIPTVGVPQAFTYNQTEELIKRIKKNQSPEVLIVYDHRNIREKWQTHLSWLDLYLPVKTLKITESDKLFKLS